MVKAMAGAESDQAKTLAFMALPEAYKPRPEAVERLETHASVVFLAGPFAYKVKRAVKYPFLDFSTLEKRRLALLNELRINTRTAPQLYLEVVPITDGDHGNFCLGGPGQVVEWVLVMRRFEQQNLYENLAETGQLSAETMRRLAEIVADFHARADRLLTPAQAVLPLQDILRDNEAALIANPDAFPPEEAKTLARASDERLAARSHLLRSRASSGYVRHCHGDLHLRNIVEIEGEPVLFDALEFDDQLATIDVLYDLAFLLMDLGKRGLTAHANAVLNAYLDREGSSGNLLGLKALPLFLSMRAMIRAKVELLRAEKAAQADLGKARGEALAYFDLARGFLASPQPRLIAIGGLSGSGKSAIARAIAPHIGAFPGAVHIRSDVERKRLFGAAPDQKLPPAAYTQGISDQIYAACRKRARLALEAGHSAIVDAVHAKPQERAAVAALAAEMGVAFTGLWLDAPREVMRERVAARVSDVSDATPDVVDAQLAYDLGKQDFAAIDASGSVAEVAAACLNAIDASSFHSLLTPSADSVASAAQ
jgi:aminoglycoside phosphotransferase family enzyme/predicted kinase